VQTPFLQNANIFIYLAKCVIWSSNLENQPGMPMVPSFILQGSDILLWYGFKWLLHAASWACVRARLGGLYSPQTTDFLCSGSHRVF